LISSTDEDGTITFEYDAKGRLIRKTDPSGDVTTFAYDANCNLIAKTDPLGNITTFEYDAAGNLVKETDPLGNVTSFAYDTNGNLVCQTEPLGSLTSYQYDSNGRAIQITESSPRQPILELETLGVGSTSSEFIYTVITNPFPDSTISIEFSIENSVRITSGVADPDFSNNTFNITSTAFSTPIPEPTIDAILQFFDQCVEDGMIEGYGPGNSGNYMLNALGNMLAMAGELINIGDIEDACVQLKAALKKCDDNPLPPDFVTGDAVTELYDMITELMLELGCE
jgi:YD repeat-containing protein